MHEPIEQEGHVSLGISMPNINKKLQNHLDVKTICSYWIRRNLTNAQKKKARIDWYI